MHRDELHELAKLAESGDLHGAMLLAVRAWARKYHPEIEDIAVVGMRGDDLAPLRVKFPVSAASAK